ncbi:hypothetical protein BHE74_00003357 [Ensete ventricosum]|nr:hypothetical protein BHE74_00003357 [Ensete ventricosum]RZR76065.1 hypothetical protein BHM03_00000670 [Ensete ventricosum]
MVPFKEIKKPLLTLSLAPSTPRSKERHRSEKGDRSWVTTRAPSPRPHPWRLRGSTSPWLRAPASSSAFPPFHYGVVKRVRFSIPFQGGEKCETPPRACSSFTVPKNLTPVMPATSCESETERR